MHGLLDAMEKERHGWRHEKDELLYKFSMEAAKHAAHVHQMNDALLGATSTTRSQGVKTPREQREEHMLGLVLEPQRGPKMRGRVHKMIVTKRSAV